MAESSIPSLAEVEKKTRSIAGYTLDMVAEKLGYVDSELTLALERVRQDMARPEHGPRALGPKQRSRYAAAMADLLGDSAALAPFYNLMVEMGIRKRLSFEEWWGRMAEAAIKRGEKEGIELWKLTLVFGAPRIPDDLADSEIIVPAYEPKKSCSVPRNRRAGWSLDEFF